MCKIFAMTNMNQVQVTPKFIDAVKNQVCKYSDKDGFGYAVLGNDGSIGGERTLRPITFKPLSGGMGTREIDKLPILQKSSNQFGNLNFKSPKSFIAHGRLSTNTISLPNTHPFVNDDVALIHNGMVRDTGGYAKEFLKSTCDSEILLRYWEMGGMEDVEQNVSGYYAMAILDKRGLLHIVRDDMATLYISWCRTVNSYIIATTKDIIKGVAKKMKWRVEAPEELLSNIFATFDSNDIVSHRAIEPLMTERWSGYGYTGYHGGSDLARKALGFHDVDTDYDWRGEDWRRGLHGSGSPGSSTTNVPTVTETTGVGKGFEETDPNAADVPAYRAAREDEAQTDTDDVSREITTDIPNEDEYEFERHVDTDEEGGLEESVEQDVLDFIEAQRKLG